MSKPIKFSTCKYCGSKDVIWEQHDGKFVLFDSYGLPHVCNEASKHFEEKRKAEADAKKKIYSDKKAELTAMIGSTCKRCDHGRIPGVFYYGGASEVRCDACQGGKVTQQWVNIELYRLRKRLWPHMFNKGRR